MVDSNSGSNSDSNHNDGNASDMPEDVRERVNAFVVSECQGLVKTLHTIFPEYRFRAAVLLGAADRICPACGSDDCTCDESPGCSGGGCGKDDCVFCQLGNAAGLAGMIHNLINTADSTFDEVDPSPEYQSPAGTNVTHFKRHSDVDPSDSPNPFLDLE